MRVTDSKKWMLAVAVLAGMGFLHAARGADKNYFPSFADEHTVGLWLFDEVDYPYTTLTDASMYEYDLRLMKAGKLVPGRFGNALKSTPGLDYNVSYASWKGHIAFAHMREVSGRPGSGLWGPTIAPQKLTDAVGGGDFTCEFWLMLMSNPIAESAIIELGEKYEPGFSVSLLKSAKGFVVENAYAGFKAVCPTELNQIWGRAWHHAAFTYKAGSGSLGYFIDGKSQGPVKVSPVAKSKAPASVWPESLNNTTYGIFEKNNRTDVPDFEVRRANRFNFAIGQDRRAMKAFDGAIDELRFSDVVRYQGDFGRPDSFSRNYNSKAAKPAVANGEPLLFGRDKAYLPNEPVMLGSRKHVFIDEVMVDRKRNIRLTVNPPAEPVITNLRGGGDAPVFDHDGKVWIIRTPGYASDVGPIRLMLSDDGVNFTEPDLGIIENAGSKHNNLILTHLPCWGRFFKDSNPNAPAEERFKFTAWVAQRGIYMYLSPDGIHWRRNETCMLPLVSGGGCETFWDDQRGVYVNLLKRDGSYNSGEYPAYGRAATLFETREATKAWPFKPVPNPYYEGWAYPAVTGEGITVMGPDLFDTDKGHVFRTRAVKYLWAPDAYVGFIARNARTELAVSRDCINWTIYDGEDIADYLGREMEVGGETAATDWIYDGLIRRGDRIWQYCPVGRKLVRFSQRLDGFASLDASETPGVIITRPFVFEGGKLTLNVDASKGSVKVAILNLPGREMTGYNVGLTSNPAKDVRCYGMADCETITSDSVQHVVKWRGSPDVANLAGQVVRLKLEMRNAKLYAFKFE